MSDEEEKKRTADAEAGTDVEGAEEEAPALKALLKRSLRGPDDAEGPSDPGAKERVLLLGVQRKLRQRSKGKFYADGWSTSQSRVNYALVAAVMLAVVVAVYLAMGPMGISPH